MGKYSNKKLKKLENSAVEKIKWLIVERPIDYEHCARFEIENNNRKMIERLTVENLKEESIKISQAKR